MANPADDNRTVILNPARAADLERSARERLVRMLDDPQLPSPPAVALQIVEKVSNPDCDLNAVCNLLAQDSALYSKLLKTVNSAYYSAGQPISSIKRAIITVGLNRLRLMVLGLSLPAIQFRVDSDVGLKRYWRASVTGAIIARELASHLRLATAADDLIASLLRDLGMLVLRQFLNDTYWPVWSGQYGIWGDRQTAWEAQIIGFDHAEVSASLLAKWGLPAEIIDPIRYHHNSAAMPPGPAALARRAQLLDLASRLTLLDEADQPPEFIQDTLALAQQKFGLDFPALEKLLSAAVPKIEEFAAILNADIGASPNFGAALASGFEELARLSALTGQALVKSPVHGTAPGLPGGAALRPAAPAAPTPRPDGAAARVVELTSPDYQWGLEGEYSLHFTNLIGQPGVSVRLRDYELVKELGRGAMGMVFQGRQRASNRPVAVKMMLPDQAKSSQAVKRFAREARLAAAIRQENVVAMHAVGEVRGVPYLVMEYVQGRSVQDWLDSGRVFSVPEIARIGHEVASGLAAAHALRLIHRDVKPANILLEDQTGRARITDFGLARDVADTDQLTVDGDLVGTPLYMSPEQVDGKKIGVATDVFSLGSLLYQLCTGVPPFAGTTIFALMLAIPSQTPAAVRSLNPDIPEWLAGVIELLHAKDPDQRPTAASVVAMLAPHLS